MRGRIVNCKPVEPQRENVQQAGDGGRGRKLAVPGIVEVGVRLAGVPDWAIVPLRADKNVFRGYCTR